LSASSRSVFRFTFFHFQASPLVLATKNLNPSERHKSAAKPACAQASNTTTSGRSRSKKLRNSAAVVASFANRTSPSSVSSTQAVVLHLPKSKPIILRIAVVSVKAGDRFVDNDQPAARIQLVQQAHGLHGFSRTVVSPVFDTALESVASVVSDTVQSS